MARNPIRRVRNMILKRIICSVRVRHNERSWIIPLIGGAGKSHLEIDRYEPELDKLFSYIFAGSSGCFIDVGANLGQTLLKIAGVNPNMRYIGFEPQSFCVYYMRRLIAYNDLQNHIVLPIALSDSPRVEFISSGHEWDSTATIVAGFWKGIFDHRTTTAIVVDTGDDILDRLNIRDITCIKIDAEGSEVDVLCGLGRNIGRCRPYIVCEVFHRNCELLSQADGHTLREDYAKNVQRLSAFASENRYATFRVAADGKLTPDTKLGEADDPNLRNCLFVPIEKVGEISYLVQGEDAVYTKAQSADSPLRVVAHHSGRPADVA